VIWPTLTLPWPHPATSLAQPRSTVFKHNTATPGTMQPASHLATRTLAPEKRPHCHRAASHRALRTGQAGLVGSAVSFHQDKYILGFIMLLHNAANDQNRGFKSNFIYDLSIYDKKGKAIPVRLSALRASRPLPPHQEDSWYSFLLEAESTPAGPLCGWKD
jgi:hypothetical protein